MSLDDVAHAFLRATRARGLDAAPFALGPSERGVTITTALSLSFADHRDVQCEVNGALGQPVEVRLAREGR
jgi:hypothetical protein